MSKSPKQPARSLNELKSRLKNAGLTETQICNYVNSALENRPITYKQIFEQCYGINSKRHTLQQVCDMHPECDVRSIRQSVLQNIELEIMKRISHENSCN